MQWWNDFIDWFNSDEGWRVISGAVIPFVAIVVAGIIGGLIGRNSTRRLLTWQDRELQSAAVAAIIGVGDRASMWSSLPSGEKDHLDAQMIAADIRLRLLPITGSSAAADWASHELALMQRNSADFSFQAQQSFVDYRDRLLEWQRRPGRARKLFAADLERFRFEANDAETELVEKQRRWAVEQQAEATRDAPTDSSDAAIVGAGTAAGTAVAIESAAPAATTENALAASAVEPEPAVSVVEPEPASPAVVETAVVEPEPVELDPIAAEPVSVEPVAAEPAASSDQENAIGHAGEPEPAPSDTAQFEATEFAAVQTVSAPETAQHETAQYETAEPETARYGTAQPETPLYETAQFDTRQFDTRQFEGSQAETTPAETAQPEMVVEPEPQYAASAAPLHEEVVPQDDEPAPFADQPAARVEPVHLATTEEVSQTERKPFVYEPFVAQPFVTESTLSEPAGAERSNAENADAQNADAEPTDAEPTDTEHASEPQQQQPEVVTPAVAPPELILPAEPQQTVSLPTSPPTTFGRRVTRPAGSGIPSTPVDPNETQPYTGPYPTREDLV